MQFSSVQLHSMSHLASFRAKAMLGVLNAGIQEFRYLIALDAAGSMSSGIRLASLCRPRNPVGDQGFGPSDLQHQPRPGREVAQAC